MQKESKKQTIHILQREDLPFEQIRVMAELKETNGWEDCKYCITSEGHRG